MSKHTPTPWKHELDNRISSDGMIFVKCFDDNDAAHIVKCVNAHDELVAALEQIHLYSVGLAEPTRTEIDIFDIARSALEKVKS